MGQKKIKLSRKAMLVVVSGIAVGMAASYNAGVAMPSPASIFTPTSTPTPSFVHLLSNGIAVSSPHRPIGVRCYLVIDVTEVTPEESGIWYPDGVFATPTPTPTPTPTLIGSSGPTSLDLLREQLLAEGRFPDAVAKELK